MLFAGNLVILTTLAIGHLGLWILFWNHMEGSGRPLSVRRWQQRVLLAGVTCLPLWFMLSGWQNQQPFWYHDTWTPNHWGLALYGILCLWFTGIVVPYTVWTRFRAARSCDVIVSDSTIHSVANLPNSAPEQGVWERMLLRFPGNECMQIEQNKKTLILDRLPRGFHGLTIAHLSDLHFNGKIGRHFFDQVVDLTNEQQPDLIAITGDIVDNLQYTDWLPTTLGRLRSRLGTYFVLGNHDALIDTDRIRRALVELGITDIASTWQRIQVGREELVLAGNELPWLGTAPDMSNCPRPSGNQFRLLLSHTPDQLPWARDHGFDLMLAGHTHNGQVCPPILGPVFCPATGPLAQLAGTFHVHPTTVHVSRGLSGENLLRLNSRPELTLLRLGCRQEVAEVDLSDKAIEATIALEEIELCCQA